MKNANTLKVYAEKPVGVYMAKAISWPFYSWVGVIDSSEIDDLDPLQGLVLNLIASNEYKKNEIGKIIGISSEVLSAVEEKCIIQGYLTPNKKLTKEYVEKYKLENYNEKDLEEASLGRKTVIFRDAISGDLVPSFNMERTNNLGFSKNEFIELKPNTVYEKTPTFIDLSIGIKALNKLNKFSLQYEETYGTQIDEMQQENIIESLELDEFDEDDEVYWEDEITQELVSKQTLGDIKKSTENEDKEESSHFDGSESIKIKSAKATLIFLEAFVYIHPDNIDEYYIRSPFGNKTDAWFLNKLRKESSKNEELRLELDILREEIIETYKDIYTFNNIHDIDLLKKLPKLSNYEEYYNVKKEIVGVHNSYNRILEGHEDYDTFFTRVQRTLECLLQILVSEMKDWKRLSQNVYVQEYRNQVERMVLKLGIDVPYNLKGNSMCKNINGLRRLNSGAIKDRSMMLLLEAYYHNKENFVLLCKQMPDFYQKIVMIADTRNKHAHYSENQLSRDEYLEKVKMIKDVFEEIMVAIFNHYIGENNNGQKE